MPSNRREFLKKTLGSGAGIAAGAVSLPAFARSLGPSSPPVAEEDELAFRKAVDLAAMVRSKEVSSEELTRYYIERIEKHDRKLNAVVVRDFDRALAAAREADRLQAAGESLGSLHGVPMTIKESFDIEGLPSTWGIPGTEKRKAEADAVVVDRFQAAGAHFMGKTNVPLNLGDFQSYNAIYGTTNNPWDTSRTPGGSSGGSAAALAAGLTALDSGSDIGGSIRNPAHFCGVYGHKPTLGIIPTRGHQPPGVPPIPQDPDLAVVGPMARSADDLALALEILAGPDALQAGGWRLELPAPRKTTFEGLRVALWPTDELAPVAREVADRVVSIGSRLSALGAQVSDTARPPFPAKLSHETYMPILNGMMDVQNSSLSYGAWMMLHGRRGSLRLGWQEFFREWDVLLCPTTATPAFAQDESDVASRMLEVDGEQRPYFEQVFWAGLATVSYLPSTVFPTGLSRDGLPIGLQAISAEYNDRTTIEFARMAAASSPRPVTEGPSELRWLPGSVGFRLKVEIY